MDARNYILDKLKLNDANQLHNFITDNKQRLSFFFPVTLEMNSSLEKTEEYIIIKNKEIEVKSNFTFAIREKDNQKIGGLIIIKKIDWKQMIG